MTFDYGSETASPEFVVPRTLLGCVKLRHGQVKLLNFQAKLFDVRQVWDSIGRRGAAHVKIGVTPAVQFTGAAQSLTGASSISILSGVVDD
jgi:hypothetical protein